MNYYKITDADGQESYYIESKTPLSNKAVKEHAVDYGYMSPFEAAESSVEKIDEDEYESSML